jgi:hypothetical protein
MQRGKQTENVKNIFRQKKKIVGTWDAFVCLLCIKEAAAFPGAKEVVWCVCLLLLPWYAKEPGVKVDGERERFWEAKAEESGLDCCKICPLWLLFRLLLSVWLDEKWGSCKSCEEKWADCSCGPLGKLNRKQ